ncbi:MAG TPA: hypothetical protein VGM33_24920 [Baekduia sp.]|jgi:hypothetical protein
MIRVVRRTLDPRLGACATVVAAFVLHQLRYALAPDRAGDAAHGYLGWAPQVLAGLASLSIGMALVRAVRAPARPERPVRSRVRMAVEAAVALLVILFCQELAEGHASLLLGHGGWIALPLAGVFGWGLTFVIGPARRVVAWIARRLRGGRARWGAAVAVVVRWCSDGGHGVVSRGLTRPGAGRGPPMTAPAQPVLIINL